MQIEGQIDIAAAPDQAVTALHDPDVLASFLLGAAQVTQTGEGSYDFLIQKELPVITLRLPGTLTITPLEGENRYSLSAAAQQLMVGSIKLTLDFDFVANGANTTAKWQGMIEATGMARQLVKQREARLPMIVGNLMHAFAHQVQERAMVASAFSPPQARG